MRCCSSSFQVKLEKAQDGHVTQGVGGGVEMVRDWKMSFVANRAQMLYKAVSKPLFGLTDVEETTLGATDAVDHIDRCAGEPLPDVKDFMYGMVSVKYRHLRYPKLSMLLKNVGSSLMVAGVSLRSLLNR
eukprot:g30790.t1